ncbi:MAG: roadblock/LC7 domain-containing protein [Candidatus Bathyarchaeota archaeon]|nr:roadblock/LC7 domain-containing protein [Candidatus Bathyarchaeota archaeon]
MSAKNKSKDDIEVLQEKLQSIKGREEIIGYILRGPNSASIDLKDPTRIVDYAILSATAFEEGQNISAMFEIGEVDSIITEGEDTKIMSMVVNDHCLSIFMEKNVDHDKLCKNLNLT